MSTCTYCNNSGDGILKKCDKCGQVWCYRCSLFGNGPYPKSPSAGNSCPYCNHNKISNVK